ncbi:MAG: hypothetical protein ACLPT4_15115 [Verrucomicrobiia bacterium]
MIKLGIVAVCGFMMCSFGSQEVLGRDDTNAISIAEVMAHLETNEASIASVTIEGTYEKTEYGTDGDVVDVKRDNFYRFSRQDHLVKAEVRGEELVPSKQSHKPISGLVDKVVFFSPQSTVSVDLRQQFAHERPVERPFPFPLYWGYGLSYSNGLHEFRILSDALEGARKQKLLLWGRDPKNPGLVLLEATWDNVTFRYWVDPQHGYLIVRYEVHESIPVPWVLPGGYDRNFLGEKWEIVPKKFGANWFYESAHMEQFHRVPASLTSMKLRVSRSVEALTVSDFHRGVSFRPGELEFSTNQFPSLRFVVDYAGKKVLNLKTGERTPLAVQGNTVCEPVGCE